MSISDYGKLNISSNSSRVKPESRIDHVSYTTMRIHLYLRKIFLLNFYWNGRIIGHHISPPWRYMAGCGCDFQEGMLGKESLEMTTERAQYCCADCLGATMLHFDWWLWIFAIKFYIFLSGDLFTVCCVFTHFPKTAQTFWLLEIIVTKGLTEEAWFCLALLSVVLLPYRLHALKPPHYYYNLHPNTPSIRTLSIAPGWDYLGMSAKLRLVIFLQEDVERGGSSKRISATSDIAKFSFDCVPTHRLLADAGLLEVTDYYSSCSTFVEISCYRREFRDDQKQFKFTKHFLSSL